MIDLIYFANFIVPLAVVFVVGLMVTIRVYFELGRKIATLERRLYVLSTTINERKQKETYFAEEEGNGP